MGLLGGPSPRRTADLQPAYAPGRVVSCYHCGRDHEVSARARSTTCPHCYRAVNMDDLVVRTDWSGKLATCGWVRIEKKAHVAARTVDAGLGVEVLGSLESAVNTPGPVVLGRRARLKGCVHATSLEVPEGAVLESTMVRIGQSADAPASGREPAGDGKEVRREVHAQPV